MNVLVLSDLHLGSKASRAAAHLDDIARVASGFDRVILNGDTLDRCYMMPITDERSLAFIADIQRTCASRNGPPELLTGNHDPIISETHWTYDEESATLIFHGDCIRDCTHPTKKTDQQLMAKLRERWDKLGGRPMDFKALHENYRAVQRLHMPSINPYKKPKTAFQYATSLIYPPRRPFDIIDYWMKAPGRALAIAKGFDKPVKHVVVGHTHRSGHWRIDGIDVYNTGSYMPFSEAFAICIEGDQIRHVKLDKLIAAAPKVVAVGKVS